MLSSTLGVRASASLSPVDPLLPQRQPPRLGSLERQVTYFRTWYHNTICSCSVTLMTREPLQSVCNLIRSFGASRLLFSRVWSLFFQQVALAT